MRYQNIRKMQALVLEIRFAIDMVQASIREKGHTRRRVGTPIGVLLCGMEIQTFATGARYSTLSVPLT